MMKKYYVEAAKKQLEKPTESEYMYCATAKAIVYAENEEAAIALGTEKLGKRFFGSGYALGAVRITKVAELPVDWSYGYGDARRSGPTETIGDLVGNHVIK